MKAYSQYLSKRILITYYLPIRQHIIYKVNLIVFKALNGDARDYIQSLLSLDQPWLRLLRSRDKVYKLIEHRWKLENKGSRSLYVATTRYWNSLPDNIRDTTLNPKE